MPMTVESVVAYLGVILAGCTAVTIADSFSAPEIAARLRIGRCKAVFTQVLRRWSALSSWICKRCVPSHAFKAAELGDPARRASQQASLPAG